MFPMNCDTPKPACLIKVISTVISIAPKLRVMLQLAAAFYSIISRKPCISVTRDLGNHYNCAFKSISAR